MGHKKLGNAIFDFPSSCLILKLQGREQELEERLRGTNELVMGSKREARKGNKEQETDFSCADCHVSITLFFKIKNKGSPLHHETFSSVIQLTIKGDINLCVERN